MAKRNLKPRPIRFNPTEQIRTKLEEKSDCKSEKEKVRHVAFPWMEVTDGMLERMGFFPGARVLFSADCVTRRIMIAADPVYTNAGKPMTEEELDQRGGFVFDHPW
jgi:toxic protein SymE